ncbi:putative Nudix hydrolase YfcD [Polystyrenella longa]|uniref:Putative Nudix hydrolase YfcD n=1 Tax=Polystyrenella longa TaxID=2528007 RepID=A0A518CRE2_9PLAN|nr:NUDIX domain-containing protein [Polystyrenella longa]QDU81801.1 putative Nudix hydrolase YfcD [Polystyrenella longa]
MTEEIFDIVNERDEVIGQAPRSQVHAEKLLHRAVHVFVFNSQGEMLLQKRTATKDEYPNCYTSSASGHVSAGETYDETAPRELEEELGITGNLQRLKKIAGTPENAYEHAVLYQLTSDAPITPDPGEIASICFLSLTETDRLVAKSPEDFTPPFLQLYRWYREQDHSKE